MSFKDHFSGHASSYARYRPGYPDALFDYLATLTSGRQLALDVATGSGQAALGLARYFERVIAIDGSLEQLRHARTHERITYVCNVAECVAVQDSRVDLLVAAQAVHWFDHARFYAEARRVLHRAGAIVVWTYGLAQVSAHVDACVRDFYANVVGQYWPPERRYIEAAYRTLPFPFAEQAAPELAVRQRWDLDTFVSYLATWSAVQRYIKAVGHDPLSQLREQLLEDWNSPEQLRSVVWPLHLRVGRL